MLSNIFGLGCRFADPAADYNAGNTVADHIGDGSCFAHEAVNAKNQRQSCHRNVSDARKCGRKYVDVLLVMNGEDSIPPQQRP